MIAMVCHLIINGQGQYEMITMKKGYDLMEQRQIIKSLISTIF